VEVHIGGVVASTPFMGRAQAEQSAVTLGKAFDIQIIKRRKNVSQGQS